MLSKGDDVNFVVEGERVCLVDGLCGNREEKEQKARRWYYSLAVRPPRLVGEPRSGSGSPTDRGIWGDFHVSHQRKMCCMVSNSPKSIIDPVLPKSLFLTGF